MAVYARKCRSCPTRVYDLDHERTGRQAPIEVAADDGAGFMQPNGKIVGGNIAINLADGTYRIVSKSRIAVMGHVGLHLNHFVRCPKAAQWGREQTGVASWTGHE